LLLFSNFVLLLVVSWSMLLLLSSWASAGPDPFSSFRYEVRIGCPPPPSQSAVVVVVNQQQQQQLEEAVAGPSHRSSPPSPTMPTSLPAPLVATISATIHAPASEHPPPDTAAS
jgi:hypothetical protein